MSLDNRPRGLPCHDAATVQKQFRLRFISKLLADRQVSLQPVNGALTDRNSSLFAAFAVTRYQSCVELNVGGAQTAKLRDAQTCGVHDFEQRAITHALIGFN